MKKIFTICLPVVILVVLSLWAGKGLFRYSYFATHDGNHHIARIYDAIGTIGEGYFPLRWAGSLNYYCGVPIFNFFYPLVYYLAVLIFPLANDVILTFKLELLGTLVFGTVFFYLWINKEVEDKRAATASAILYLFAPYRFLNIFVRGDIAESLAYAILPLVLYFFSQAFGSTSKKRIVIFSFLASITAGLLTISHNFTAMFVMPIILAYLVVKIYQLKQKSLFKIAFIIFGFISAFGFAAFFIFPALLEVNYTQIPTPRFLYSDHFPALWQLIHSKWDYFYSAPGTALDGMSFELGYAHWVVLVLSALYITWLLTRWVKNKKMRDFKGNISLVFFFVLSSVFIYLMLDSSTLIWRAIPLLQTIQFPWRLLGIAVFGISALFPFFVIGIKNKFLYWGLVIGISALAIIGNRNHLLPQPVLESDRKLFADFDKYHYERHSTTTFADDIVAPGASACWPDTPVVTSDFDKPLYDDVIRSNTTGHVKFTLDKLNTDRKLIFGLGYFPGILKMEINGKSVEPLSCGGRVCVSLGDAKPGENTASWKIGQTPIENVFNIISIAFGLVWAAIVVLNLTKYKPSRIHFLLLGIFCAFLFFRFYHLEQRIAFGWDQERDANAAIQIIAGDLKLLGPRVLSDTGFFLPPYFFYLITPFYKLSGGSPYAMIPFLLSYNVAFFLISWLVVKKLFNEKVALIFLALWAVTPIPVSADILSWNPLLVPLFVILLLCFLNFEKWRKIKFKFLVVGLVWGLGLSMHVQMLLLAPIVALAIYKEKKGIKQLITGILITFSPVIFFDLFNNFLNFRLLKTLLNSGLIREPFSFLLVWDNFVSRLLGTPPNRLVSLVFYLFILLLLFLRKKDYKIFGLFCVWVSFPIFFLVYGNRPSEYYFVYLAVVILLTLSIWLAQLKGKWSLVLIGILLFYLSLKSTDVLKDGIFGIYKKDSAVKFISEITKNTSSFNVSFQFESEGDAGFRYLLAWRGVKYSGNPSDPLIQFTTPPRQKSTFIVNAIGIEIPQSWLEKNWPRQTKP